MRSSIDQSPQHYARIGGLIYLAIILLGLYGELFVRGALIVDGDPAATVGRIAAAPFLWRSGIVADLMMQVLDVPLIVILYLLLRPVSASLALTSTLLNLVQTAVLALNKLSLLLPLFLLQDAGYLRAFQLEQLQVLSYLAIKLHGHGFALGLLFFGFTCLIQGYLMFKSGYFPKWVGLMMQIAGLSYLVNTLTLILAPDLAGALFPAVLMPAFIGELSVCLWLILKGVKLPQWEQRLGRAHNANLQAAGIRGSSRP